MVDGWSICLSVCEYICLFVCPSFCHPILVNFCSFEFALLSGHTAHTAFCCLLLSLYYAKVYASSIENTFYLHIFKYNLCICISQKYIWICLTLIYFTYKQLRLACICCRRLKILHKSFWRNVSYRKIYSCLMLYLWDYDKSFMETRTFSLTISGSLKWTRVWCWRSDQVV